jgi:hypothetical protein
LPYAWLGVFVTQIALTGERRRWHRRRRTAILLACVTVESRATPPPNERNVHMAQITINEGLAWLKTLQKRHEELLALRNENAHRERRFLGSSADRELVREPVYDIKVIDRMVTRVAREVRLLDQALKATNARTIVEGYSQDDSVLGELS